MNELKEQSQQEAIINNKCDAILAKADKSGLQLEVVWSAFKHKEQFYHNVEMPRKKIKRNPPHMIISATGNSLGKFSHVTS